MRLFAWVLAVALVGCSGPAVADPPDEPLTSLVDRDVPYTSALTLDVYYPDTGGPWPVAVVLHGGEDHKTTMKGFARAVSRRGIVVFVPEWRSFPEQLEEHRLGAMEDVACSVRFAAEHAADYGGTGGSVVMAGWSLGGNFAAIAALREEPAGGDCLADGEPGVRVQGVVGLDAVYDFTELLVEEPSRWTKEEMDEISAHSYVRGGNGDDPPSFMLFTGSIEQLNAQAERFRSGLEHAGFPVDLIPNPELSHGAVIFAPGAVDAVVDLAFP